MPEIVVTVIIRRGCPVPGPPGSIPQDSGQGRASTTPNPLTASGDG